MTIDLVKVGRAMTLERAIKKRSKELIPKMKQKKIAITLQGAIEKSTILLSQYWKHELTKKVISYFGDTNNILADDISYKIPS